MREKNTTAAVGGIFAVTLLGKLLGLARDRLLATNYGAGMSANAFLTASRIPRVFFDAVFASAIAISFIPAFSAVYERDGKAGALRFGSEFTSLTAYVTLAVSALGVMFAEPLTRLFAAGYDAETLALAVKLTRIMFPTVFFTGIAFSFVGILQSLEHFALPAAISVVSNGIIIAYYAALNEKFGIWGLSAAFLLGWAGQAAVMLPRLVKSGFRPALRVRLRGGDMRGVGKLMLPAIVSTWVQPICLAVGTRFASGLRGGAAVTELELAMNLYTIIIGVFALSVTNVLFPRISRLEAAGRGAIAPARAAMLASVAFAALAAAGTMLLAKPAVSVIYGGGKFGADSVVSTASALRWCAPGMPGYAATAVLGRVYFARRNGKTPLLAGAAAIAVNVVLCGIFTGALGIRGIALASSAAATVNAVLLALPLAREGLFDGGETRALIKQTVSRLKRGDGNSGDSNSGDSNSN
ncbi:MAG: murein biosynthesis integral membrane protein MurJ [Oscillospiraceae bacterium]|nr:murein biosynthesis integral membrane protein MurJ [Oscillospiraceae bacterium]